MVHTFYAFMAKLVEEYTCIKLREYIPVALPKSMHPSPMKTAPGYNTCNELIEFKLALDWNNELNNIYVFILSTNELPSGKFIALICNGK